MDLYPLTHYSLTHDQAHDFLDALSHEAAALGRRPIMFIGGGVTLMLSLALRDRVADADIIAAPWDMTLLKKLGFEVADKMRLVRMGGKSWFDSAITESMAQFTGEPEKYFSPYALFRDRDGNGLRAHLLKPEPQLALKMLRRLDRMDDKDSCDAYNLCRHLTIRSPDALWQLRKTYKPLLPFDARVVVSEEDTQDKWAKIENLADWEKWPPLKLARPKGIVRSRPMALSVEYATV
jgi:hypothetical protein